MTDLFKNKYRISSARLQSWNYADNGMYFITICTANRECFFGNVVETQCIASLPDASGQISSQYTQPEYKMELNNLGRIAEIEWLKTKELRPDMNLELLEFVVMPNHFHGIIYINDNQYNTAKYENYHRSDAMHCAPTSGEQIDNPNNLNKNKFGPQTKNLAAVIRGFKSSVTTYARKNNIPFDWQSRFHEHIISTNREYVRIADYILDNPGNWNEDKFHTK
jgi:putative transposase